MQLLTSEMQCGTLNPRPGEAYKTLRRGQGFFTFPLMVEPRQPTLRDWRPPGLLQQEEPEMLYVYLIAIALTIWAWAGIMHTPRPKPNYGPTKIFGQRQD